MMSDSKTHTYARMHTHTHKLTRMHTYTNVRPPDAAQQQKGQNYSFKHMRMHKSAAEINVVAVPR